MLVRTCTLHSFRVVHLCVLHNYLEFSRRLKPLIRQPYSWLLVKAWEDFGWFDPNIDIMHCFVVNVFTCPVLEAQRSNAF